MDVAIFQCQVSAASCVPLSTAASLTAKTPSTTRVASTRTYAWEANGVTPACFRARSVSRSRPR